MESYVPRSFQGQVRGTGLRIGVVVARFNQAVTDALLAGALEALATHGVAEDAIDVATVPGAFELPLCAQRLAGTGRYDALICLGAVVRGDTPHFDYVAGEAARGTAEVARRFDLPVAFGVLTTDTMDQALARAGGTHGNKGYDAAVTALEMVDVLRVAQRF
jgi:6,7-dimethyl-8-ribityllumazine synthase